MNWKTARHNKIRHEYHSTKFLYKKLQKMITPQIYIFSELLKEKLGVNSKKPQIDRLNRL
jgi:hypothetical protein